MNILLKAAKILDASSTHHNTQQDIYIENGTIKAVGKNLSYPNATEISYDNLHVSQGWFDSSVSFGEPGFEERETIANGLNVAARSGFSHIAYNTNTQPKPDSRADIAFLLEQASGSSVKLYPKACVTTSQTDEKLAPLRELHAAGTVSFSACAPCVVPWSSVPAALAEFRPSTVSGQCFLLSLGSERHCALVPFRLPPRRVHRVSCR